MIPSMIVNAYMNFCLIKLAKRYPEQWKSSTLHRPMPIFNCLCVIGGICACAVAFHLFKDLDTASMLLSVVLLAAALAVSKICVSTGRVKVEDLLSKREKIAAAAIAATSDEN